MPNLTENYTNGTRISGVLSHLHVSSTNQLNRSTGKLIGVIERESSKLGLLVLGGRVKRLRCVYTGPLCPDSITYDVNCSKQCQPILAHFSVNNYWCLGKGSLPYTVKDIYLFIANMEQANTGR